MSNINFRNYQIDCLNKLETYYENSDRGIICVPTGGGKTIIFSKFAENNPSLIVSHTEELVTQAKYKYEFVNSKVCGIANSNNWETEQDTVSGSIQTLAARCKTKEFQDLIQNIKFLIVDEAHHFPAKSYMNVYNEILKYNKDVKLLGVTATPFRTDKLELKNYFDEMVFSISIKDLILQDYLVPTKAKMLKIPENLSDFENVKITKNKDGITDFSLKSLSAALGEEKVIEWVIDKFISEWEKRKTIFFTSGIEISKKITEVLVSKGVKAVHIDGTMSKANRNEIIEDYRKGKIEVISNVDILTEGFDDPSTECVALLRPTKSLNLYSQMIGRGLRPSMDTEKHDCLVLDFTPATAKFSKNLANLFELFELEADKKSKNRLTQFTINRDKNRNLVVNFGTSEDELELFDFKPDMSKFYTEVQNRKIVSCGNKKNLILAESKSSNGLYKIEIINTINGNVQLIDSIPENIVSAKLDEIWEENTNITAIEKSISIDKKDEDIQYCLDTIKSVNREIFSHDNLDSSDFFLETDEDFKKMNSVQLELYKKYLNYYKEFFLKQVKKNKQIICENLSINDSHIKFSSIDQLLHYYEEHKDIVEFENKVMEDIIKFISPIEDKKWIPENVFITKRTINGFYFKFTIDGEKKSYYIDYQDISDKEFYKSVITYIIERIHFIRKNKETNLKYYKVPTISLLKELRPITKKLKFYQEVKQYFQFK